LLIALRLEPGVSIAGASNFPPLEAAWRGAVLHPGPAAAGAGDELQAQHQRWTTTTSRAGRAARQGRFFDPRTPPGAGAIINNDARAPAMARRGSGRQAYHADSRRRPDGAIADADHPIFQVVGVVAR
jgi:hypothetical protein